jgi:hypothetical protein
MAQMGGVSLGAVHPGLRLRQALAQPRQSHRARFAGEDPQHLVADGVTMLVVDAFEVIQVDQRQAQAASRARAA